MIAETVGAALGWRGFNVRVVRLDARPVTEPFESAPAEAGLLISDLASYRSIRVARAMTARVVLPWVVVTSASRGPVWGALLESGASRVGDSSNSIVEIATLLESLVSGTCRCDPELEDDLRCQWRHFERERSAVLSRLRALTPRELTILRSLHSGRTVPEIAAAHGIGELAVRNQVQVLLLKLDLGSQLAAVGRLGELLVLDPEPGTPRDDERSSR